MTTQLQTIDEASLTIARGGVNWEKVGEYAAPALITNPFTAPLGIYAANKPAAAQAGVWAAAGALAGLAGGPKGVALGAAGGGLAGYYGSLLSRDFPMK